MGLSNAEVNASGFRIHQLIAVEQLSHAQLINRTYQSALSEYKIERKLMRIVASWEHCDLKFAQHIADSIFMQGFRVAYLSNRYLIARSRIQSEGMVARSRSF